MPEKVYVLTSEQLKDVISDSINGHINRDNIHEFYEPIEIPSVESISKLSEKYSASYNDQLGFADGAKYIIDLIFKNKGNE